jgi:hypothetical protein
MTNNEITSQWLTKWIAASTISWMVAALFGEACRSLAWHNLNLNIGWSMFISAITTLSFGAIATSLAQEKILHSANHEIDHWKRASLKGWLLGIGVGILIFIASALLLAVAISVLIPGSDEGSSWARPLTFAIFALPIAAIFGGLGIFYFIGVFQAKILNQLAQQNRHWVRTSIISGIVGLFVVIIALIILRTRASSTVVLGILGAIYGMITSAITGTRLTSLLSLRAEKEESVTI